MKPEFCLQEVWDGWQSVRSPDNIEFIIQLSNKEYIDMSASILELVELYDNVRKKEDCDMMIGTGNIIQVKASGEEVVLTIDEEHDVKTSFSSLDLSIKQLLQDIFSELDGGPSRMPDYEQEAYPCIEEIYSSISK